MKVLQINSVCGIGSTGRIATDINALLLEQNHESVIAFGRNESKNCNRTIKIGTNKDINLHVLKTRIFDRHGFGSKTSTVKLISEIKELDPDIIHLHNIHGYYLNIEILFDFLREFNKPVIWTLHDCWAFTGHCAYFDYAGCNKWVNGCFECPERNSYPQSLFIDNSKANYVNKKKIFNDIDNLTIVTPSLWLADLLKKSFLSNYSVKVINNGIDLNTFKPVKSDFRYKHDLEDKFIILGIASEWDRRKGLKYFIELSEIIAEDMKIVLVGLNKRQIEQLPSSIIGISRTNNINELVEIYSSSDVFVNPTLEDNFPTTNIEALACGTPIVTFNTGGSPESVDDKTGFVVEKGNLLELYKSAMKIKEKGRGYFTDAAIEKAHQNYDKEEKFKEYINMYEEKLRMTKRVL